MVETLMKNNSHHVVVVPTRDVKAREKNPAHIIEPPDGGTRAYLVMISAFLCNGILFGIINTYSVVYLSLQKKLRESDDIDASSKASLVGALTIGSTFFFSFISGILVDKLGLRTTTFLGGVLTTAGMYLSSLFVDPFEPENIYKLYITYGVMFGTGAALAYTPTLAILGHYFKKKLGVVNGFVTAGSSVFTAILPGFLTYLESDFGLKYVLYSTTIMSAFIILFSFIYKPLQPPPPPKERKIGRSECYNITRSLVNFDNWKRKKYIIWVISVPVALFGYFVPYVHIGKFIQGKFPGDNHNWPLICIGLTSGLGRLVFGVISDSPRVDRILLQQISFTLIGLMTICLPFTSSYSVLIVVCLSLGFFDGCFISLLGPIAYDICGPHGAAQAIGFLLALCSFGLTMGPPLAGKLYDSSESYTLPFVAAGIPPFIGAAMMFLMKFVKEDRNLDKNANEERALHDGAQIAWEKSRQIDMKPIEERRAAIPGTSSPLLKTTNISHLVEGSRSEGVRKYAYSCL